jgi:bacteriocin-like protein
MNDHEKKPQSTSISPQPGAENKKKQSTELSEEELSKVSGGDENISFNFTKVGTSQG